MSQTASPVATLGAQGLDSLQFAAHAGFAFRVESIPFNEDYQPSETTRLTTNFANLARGANRRENLRRALRMIDNRFNALAHWDNAMGDRYSVELEIISVEMEIDAISGGTAFPLIEMLGTTIVDRKSDRRIEGVAGNNFSSYLRDYDFNVLLPAHNAANPEFSTPPDFGILHGNLFRSFVQSGAYRERLALASDVLHSHWIH